LEDIDGSHSECTRNANARPATYVAREKQILSVNQWSIGQDGIEKYTADIS